MNITLQYQSGTSDKVYKVSVDAAGNDLYRVNFAYGRRGSTLNTGTKTQEPIPLEQAEKIFRKLSLQKMKKGYHQVIQDTSYVVPDDGRKESGVRCQLLNAIDETDLADYLDNPLYVAQEKYDGRRMLVKKADGQVSGVNRRGLTTGLPAAIVESAERLPGEFVIDGEAVGDTLHAFDLLELDLTDLRSQPYWVRIGTLNRLLGTLAGGSVQPVSTASTAAGKRELLERLRDDNREGIVFKNTDAPYIPGRPASGGNQVKFKFYETASCLVTARNDKRSVSLALKNGYTLVPCGNVAIPANYDIPDPGQVVEARYLYAMPGSNALYQPVYLGQRDDIPAHDCTLDQLKYKAA